MKVGGNVGGGALAAYANKIPVGNGETLGTKVDPKLLGAGKVLIAAFVPDLLFKKKNQFVEDAAAGMITVGGLEILKALLPADQAPELAGFPTLSGPGYDMPGGSPTLNGAQTYVD